MYAYTMYIHKIMLRRSGKAVRGDFFPFIFDDKWLAATRVSVHTVYYIAYTNRNSRGYNIYPSKVFFFFYTLLYNIIGQNYYLKI